MSDFCTLHVRGQVRPLLFCVRQEGELEVVQLIPSLNHQGQDYRERPFVQLNIVTVTFSLQQHQARIAVGYLPVQRQIASILMAVFCDSASAERVFFHFCIS